MAKPTNTIGDRDYGRRTYTSNKTYEEQRKLATDTHIDRVRQLEKHSEFKKPYLPDQSYPEMEGFNFDPYDPKWPGLPPGEPPTTGPVDPGGPVVVKPTPDREIPPFLGCMFFSRRMSPTVLSPGQIAFGGVDFGSQDSIVGISVYGPATLFGSDPADIALCNESTRFKMYGWKERKSNRGFCLILLKAKDNPKDFNHVTKYFTIGSDDPGPYPIIVEVTMLSGAVCVDTLRTVFCENAIKPVWDFDRSASIINSNSSGVVYLKDGTGTPPFHWSISGTNFSLVQEKTDSGSNIVVAGANACGTGTITVTDVCGLECVGSVRSTSGRWAQDAQPTCWPEISGQRVNKLYGVWWAEYGGHRGYQIYQETCNWTTSPCNESQDFHDDGWHRGGMGDCIHNLFGYSYPAGFCGVNWQPGPCLFFDCYEFGEANPNHPHGMSGSPPCCQGGGAPCSDGSYRAVCIWCYGLSTASWVCN